MQKIYHLGERGELIGEGVADVDPLNPGRFLIPRQAVTVAPPVESAPAGKEWAFGDVETESAGVGIDGEPVTLVSVVRQWRAVDLPAPPMAPELPQRSPAEVRREEIMLELSAIDARSIRPLREGDAARVAQLESQAAALRVELAGLGV